MLPQLNITLHVHSTNCNQKQQMEMHDFELFWQCWRFKGYKQKNSFSLRDKTEKTSAITILAPSPFFLIANQQMVPFFCAQLKCVLIVKKPQGL